MGAAARRWLFVEPFYGGSHRAFADRLIDGVPGIWTLASLPARHWKWRMRGAALWLSEWWAAQPRRAEAAAFDGLITTSLFPLAELGGVVPALAGVPKLCYFHENQFAYPRQSETDAQRDTHFAFTQISAAVAADRCVFNSEFNRSTFFAGAVDLLRRMPDARPMQRLERARELSTVLPVPVDAPRSERRPPGEDERSLGPIILWNHRWEHDKAPERFFAALRGLRERGLPFRLIVCGESYGRQPAVFEHARREFADCIVHFGHLADRSDYEAALRRADIAVSTATQEFFGIAMLEATLAGAYPLVPERLVYPEIYPERHRYADEAALEAMLTQLCERWAAGEPWPRDEPDWAVAFAAANVLPHYVAALEELAASASP